MNMKSLYIFSLLAAFIGGYLTSTFLANNGSLESDETQGHGALAHKISPQSKQRQITGDMSASHFPHSANRPARFSSNSKPMAKSQSGWQYATTGAETSKEWLFEEPSEEDLLVEPSEEELIAQAELDWEIAAELERLEREHGFEETDDVANDTVTELSEAEMEDQRLGLEMDIAEEMKLQQSSKPFYNANIAAYETPVVNDSTAEKENQRLAIEEAIEMEMESLAFDQDSNHTGSTSLP